MMGFIRLGVLLYTMLALFAGTLARAEIYEWHDKDGVSHFTNDTQAIPSEYRSSMHVMMEDNPAAQAQPKAASAPTPKQARRLNRRARGGGQSGE